jgi:hypothetical protein
MVQQVHSTLSRLLDTSNATGRMVAGVLASLAEVGVGAWSGTSGSGAGSASGTRTVHRTAQGARQIESRSSAENARER